MDEGAPSQSGLSGSFRRLFAVFLEILHTRLELLGAELEEERQRLLVTLLWSAAAFFFGMMAVITLTIAVAMACPEGARPWVLLGACLLYVALAVGAGLVLRRNLRERQPPFSASLGELKKDLSWLRQRP